MDQFLEAIGWEHISAFFVNIGVWFENAWEILTSEHYGQRMLASIGVVLGFLIISWMVSRMPYKFKRIVTPERTFCVGVFFAAVVWFMPIYDDIFSNLVVDASIPGRLLRVHEAALQNAMRLFALDDSYLDLLTYVPTSVRGFYAGWGFVLYIVAPVLTVGFVLTFFKNLMAYSRYGRAIRKRAHVFSELNEHTLALASSIDAHYNKNSKGKYKLCRKALIVFCDILHRNEEEHLDLMAAANEMGAILFRKDITSVLFIRNRMHFYLISEDESEKLQHAVRLMSRYDHKNNKLYLFSNSSQSDLLVSTKKTKHMEVRRINAIQSLIYDNLEKNGVRLFKNAKDGKITAVIVGLGKYGMEMFKALIWFCQMEGYSLTVHAFDADKRIEEKISLMCPELLEKCKKENDGNDACYSVEIHSADVNSGEFMQMVGEITDVTYVFVGLGTDDLNTAVSAKIRALYGGMKSCGMCSCDPDIETIIYDSNVKDTIGCEWSDDPNAEVGGAINYKKQPYGIHMIGDLDSFYSYDTLIATGSELERAGEKVHSRWSDCTAADEAKQPQIMQMLKDQQRMQKLTLVCAAPESETPKGEAKKNKKDKPAPFVLIPVEESAFESGELSVNGRNYLHRIEQLLCDQYKAMAKACVYAQADQDALIHRMKSGMIGDVAADAAHIRRVLAPYALTLYVTEESLTNNLRLHIIPCGLMERYSTLCAKVKAQEKLQYAECRLREKWNGAMTKPLEQETLLLITRDAQMDESSVLTMTLEELKSLGSEANGHLYDDVTQAAILSLLRRYFRVPYDCNDIEDSDGILWDCLTDAYAEEHGIIIDTDKRDEKNARKAAHRVFGVYIDFAADHSFLVDLSEKKTDDRVSASAEYCEYRKQYRKMEQYRSLCSACAHLSLVKDEDEPVAANHTFVLNVGKDGQVVSCEALSYAKMQKDMYSNRFASAKLYRKALKQLYERYPAKEHKGEKGILARIDWEKLAVVNESLYFVLNKGAHTVELCTVQAGLDERLQAAVAAAEQKEKQSVNRADSTFYRYEYYYRSSVTKAMHERLRDKLYCECLLPADSAFTKAVAVADRTKRNAEQTLAICRVEHCRWNAFMRTEGFRYAAKRNDLAKLHNNIVPTNQLSDDDLRKDA